MYRENILKALQEANRPLGIDTIRAKAGIKAWETTKAILLELMAEGKIVGMKTGKGWIFGRPEVMEVVKFERR